MARKSLSGMMTSQSLLPSLARDGSGSAVQRVHGVYATHPSIPVTVIVAIATPTAPHCSLQDTFYLISSQVQELRCWGVYYNCLS